MDGRESYTVGDSQGFVKTRNGIIMSLEKLSYSIGILVEGYILGWQFRHHCLSVEFVVRGTTYR
jgi:hypothetical protein